MRLQAQPHVHALSHTHTDQNLLFPDPTELNYNSLSIEHRENVRMCERDMGNKGYASQSRGSKKLLSV